MIVAGGGIGVGGIIKTRSRGLHIEQSMQTCNERKTKRADMAGSTDTETSFCVGLVVRVEEVGEGFFLVVAYCPPPLPDDTHTIYTHTHINRIGLRSSLIIHLSSIPISSQKKKSFFFISLFASSSMFGNENGDRMSGTKEITI